MLIVARLSRDSASFSLARIREGTRKRAADFFDSPTCFVFSSIYFRIRRDTLNRHARLHNRKVDAGAPAKGRKKKIKGNASNAAAEDKLELTPRLMRDPLASPIILPRSPTSPPSASFDFKLLPDANVQSRPITSDESEASAAYDAAAVLSNPPVRRHSNVTFTSDFRGNDIAKAASPYLFERRSSTLPKYYPDKHDLSLGSPLSSTSSSSSSDADDSNDRSYQTSVEIESQYPSPAFTSYSPSALHVHSELEALLANEPVHHPAIASQQIPHQQGTFHEQFELAFIQSLEGPARAPAPSPYGLNLHLPAPREGMPRADRLPTPHLNHFQPLPVSHNYEKYDFTQQLRDEERRQDQLRQIQQQSFHQRSRSMTLPSLAIPSMSMPSNPPPPMRSRHSSISSTFPPVHEASSYPLYPSLGLLSAYSAATFAPLILPSHNELGLLPSPEQSLFEAYSRRKNPAALSSPGLGGSTDSGAFYVPSHDKAIGDGINHTGVAASGSGLMDHAFDPLGMGFYPGMDGQGWSDEEKREGSHWLLG